MMRKIIRFDVDAIQSPKSVRLWLWWLVLRLALLSGHPVALIGACRTGKTLLLNKLTSNVIDKQPEAISTGRSDFTIDEKEIPSGMFGIDECQLIAPSSMVSIAVAMAEQRRSFVMCCQQYRDIERAITYYRYHEKSKSLVIVVMGGYRNPNPVLEGLG
jgi:hypothetical protein